MVRLDISLELKMVLDNLLIEHVASIIIGARA
jgi:hypothetical protein